MCVTAIQTETERKRQDKSVHRAEKRRRWAGMMQVCGPTCPHSGVLAHSSPARGTKHLIRWQPQAKIMPDCGPLGEFRINADPAHLHGRVDHCLLTDRPEGPYPVTNSLHPQRTDTDTMPKARGSAGGHAARKDSDMRIPRAWVAVAGIVSCLLMLQGCGALQGCPDRTTICRMM